MGQSEAAVTLMEQAALSFMERKVKKKWQGGREKL